MAQLDTALVPDASFLFPLGGVTPLGNGTVTLSNLQGDIDSPIIEQWTIRLGSTGSGVVLGLTTNGAQCGGPAPESVFNVTQAQLQAAISGGSIEISAQSGGSINAGCLLTYRGRPQPNIEAGFDVDAEDPLQTLGLPHRFDDCLASARSQPMPRLPAVTGVRPCFSGQSPVASGYGIDPKSHFRRNAQSR